MRSSALAIMIALSIPSFGLGQGLPTHHSRAQHYHKQTVRRPATSAAESHIGQVSEKLRAPGNEKLPPEGAALGATTKKTGAIGAVNTQSSTHCTGANASSTECYTATQQGRPLAK